MPLHGPTLYHMTRDQRAVSPQGRCSLVTHYFPHLISSHMPTPMTPLLPSDCVVPLSLFPTHCTLNPSLRQYSPGPSETPVDVTARDGKPNPLNEQEAKAKLWG